MDEYLEINIELKSGVAERKELTKSIETHIYNRLREINIEYLDVSTKNEHRSVRPVVKLRPYQDIKYFKVGLKPRYIYSPIVK